MTDDERARLRAAYMPPVPLRAVLASPNLDVLDCLLANGLPQRLGLALLNPDGPLSEADERVLDLLRARPDVPLLLLHDASVEGCLLPALLPERWDLAPSQRVLDLGLRPRQAMRAHRFTEYTIRGRWMKTLILPRTYDPAPSPQMLERLEQEAQRQQRVRLSEDELAWLREGCNSSVLFMPPAWMVTLVTRAVERYAPARGVDSLANAQARAIGYMTWPMLRAGTDGQNVIG
ncbi:MAG: hypothetical protein RMK84_02035 [Oscillochloridaceae bacterium]|nr:hypothetical protein [Chloroflexaceae bacterium]MDW8388881.1 hypothetical protein [Oscillochloridaceae bacterium]